MAELGARRLVAGGKPTLAESSGEVALQRYGLKVRAKQV